MAIIKFQTNIPQEVVLSSLAAEEVEGNFGPQFLYQLGDDRLYATALLHKTLQEVLEPGTYRVAKMEGEGGKIYWTVSGGRDGTILADSRSLGGPQTPQEAAKPTPTPGPTQATQAPTERHRPSLVDVGAQMFSCLRMAEAMWGFLQMEAKADTIQATAATMYIQANKLALQPNERQLEAFRALMAEVAQADAKASEGVDDES